jgi:hypothetical protein
VIRPESGPPSCGICNKNDFRGFTALLNHIEIAHFSGAFEHKCDVCGSFAKTNAALKKHFYRHHRKTELQAKIN